MYLHDSINGRVASVRRHYDRGFVATPGYIETLPDIIASADGPAAPIPIQQVGVSNFGCRSATAAQRNAGSNARPA